MIGLFSVPNFAISISLCLVHCYQCYQIIDQTCLSYTFLNSFVSKGEQPIKVNSMIAKCQLLVFSSYKEKRWTRHEWRSAQERAFLQPDTEYLLPVRLVDTTLDGLIDTLGYIDGRTNSMRKIARLTFEKVGDFTQSLAKIRLADQKYRLHQVCFGCACPVAPRDRTCVINRPLAECNRAVTPKRPWPFFPHPSTIQSAEQVFRQ